MPAGRHKAAVYLGMGRAHGCADDRPGRADDQRNAAAGTG